MKVELTSDQPINDDSCRAATGATLTEWFDRLAAKPELAGKRRDSIQWMYAENGKDMWWATTVWVQFEALRNVIKKDGLAEGYSICVTKTIAATIPSVYSALKAALAEEPQATITRDRESKDLRYKWHTAGVPNSTELDIVINEAKGKVLVTLTHGRIQTRDEADGLRRAWGTLFDRTKTVLEH